MNENLKKARLLFELARKQTEVEVVAGSNAMSSSRAKGARADFDYNRNMTMVRINEQMLNGENLASSVQTVASQGFVINEFGEIERGHSL